MTYCHVDALVLLSNIQLLLLPLLKYALLPAEQLQQLAAVAATVSIASL